MLMLILFIITTILFFSTSSFLAYNIYTNKDKENYSNELTKLKNSINKSLTIIKKGYIIRNYTQSKKLAKVKVHFIVTNEYENDLYKIEIDKISILSNNFDYNESYLLDHVNKTLNHSVIKDSDYDITWLIEKKDQQALREAKLDKILHNIEEKEKELNKK